MKISVKMTARDLFWFSMYNAYRGFTGVFNVIFTVGALGILAATWTWESIDGYQRALLVFCALLFTVVQPFMLSRKSRLQARTSGFSAPVNLTLGDDGIKVEKAGMEAELSWKQVWKIVRIKPMYIIKTGPTHGYLIPNRVLEGREKELVEIFRKNLPDSKTKGLKKW